MSRASTLTLLSLDRFAAIMGIAPPHFNQAVGAAIFPAGSGCSGVYWQFAWQMHDRVAREDLAYAIQSAEEDIARLVGYWPAPVWVNDEVVHYPRHHRTGIHVGGLQETGLYKSVRTQWGKVIDGGRRASTFIITPTTAGGDMVFSDEDGDAFDETVTITFATVLTDIREIHVYFPDHDGDPAWEIRPLRSIEIAGGICTIVAWAWQFIDPTLWEAYPTTAGLQPINLTAAASYVDEVDVYRVYNDQTSAMATFYWEPASMGSLTLCSYCGGTGCTMCGYTTADGCIHVRDALQGIVVPQPADYDRSTDTWEYASPEECRDPDLVKLWYLAGDRSDAYIGGTAHDPLSDWWAKLIAEMAVARLERDLCACNNVTSLAAYLRQDLAQTTRDGPSWLLADNDLSNPFGTHRGEVMAWRKLRSHHTPRRVRVAAI